MRLSLHLAATAAAIGLFAFVKPRLDAAYAASRHPVDFATGQTTFDGQRIKGFYAVMQEAGTLDIYVKTQIIDFAFITAVALLGLTLGTLVARLGPNGGWGRRLGLWAAITAIAGAAMDACENLVSFVMLADPQGFPDWLALPYSGFASAKFALLTLAMALLLASLLAGGVERLLRRPRLGQEGRA